MKKNNQITALVFGVIAILIFVWFLNDSINKKTDDKNPITVSADEQVENVVQNTITEPDPEPEEKLIPTEDSLIPILMYHHVKDWTVVDNEIEKGLSVPIADFEGQMKALADAGYETVGLDELFFEPQDKKVVLTFDDGYDNNLINAAPIMKKYGFSATLFVTTNFIGKPRYLSWDDVKKLRNEYNWTIGAHTQSHPNLTELGIDKAMEEIQGGKKIIEENIGSAIKDFSYPAGQFNVGIIDIVKNAGFEYAVTTVGGSHNFKSNPYELKRVRINGGLGVQGFIGLMEL